MNFEYEKSLAILKSDAKRLLETEIKSSDRCNAIAEEAKRLGENFPHNGGPQWEILRPIFQKTNAWHMKDVENFIKSKKNIPA